LDPSLLRHYLRGYFDGDGWFSVGRSGHVRKRDGQRGSILNWGIIGTDAFCADACRFLIREANVRSRPPEPHPVSAGMSLLKYGGNLQVSRIYRLLYKGASVWLPRKRDIAEPHIRFTRRTWPRLELRALSKPDVAEVRRLREMVLSLQTIADRFGVSERTIRSNVPPTRRTPPLTPDEVRQVRKLYDEGRANHRQLAAKYGVGTSTIGRVIRREGRWAADVYD
jgi:transposase